MFEDSSNRFAARAMLAAAIGSVATAASAAPTDMVGWLLANKPAATSPYVPAAATSFNSQGLKNIVSPYGSGYYQVEFRGLYNGGFYDNMQVSAVGTSGYCLSSGWDAQGNDHSALMWVRCF